MYKSLMIVDDFFEDPHYVRNKGLSHLIECHGDKIMENSILNDDVNSHPGFTTKNFLDIDPDLNEDIADKVSEILGASVLMGPMFYLASSVHKCGLVHNDLSQMAGVIYLNENPPENSGTVLYDKIKPEPIEISRKLSTGYRSSAVTNNLDEIESFNKFKKEYNEEYFQPDCVVQNKFNRCIIYGGKRMHGAHDYFGKNIFDSRLVIAFSAEYDTRD